MLHQKLEKAWEHMFSMCSPHGVQIGCTIPPEYVMRCITIVSYNSSFNELNFLCSDLPIY